MAVTKKVPEKVKLRDERRRVKNPPESRHDDGEVTYVPYEMRPDDELERIISTNPLRTLEQWFSIWRTRHQLGVKQGGFKSCGVHLIPGRLQELLGLPVRQVYIHYWSIYRIEGDGQVTTKLL